MGSRGLPHGSMPTQNQLNISHPSRSVSNSAAHAASNPFLQAPQGSNLWGGNLNLSDADIARALQNSINGAPSASIQQAPVNSHPSNHAQQTRNTAPDLAIQQARITAGTNAHIQSSGHIGSAAPSQQLQPFRQLHFNPSNANPVQQPDQGHRTPVNGCFAALPGLLDPVGQQLWRIEATMSPTVPDVQKYYALKLHEFTLTRLTSENGRPWLTRTDIRDDYNLHRRDHGKLRQGTKRESKLDPQYRNRPSCLIAPVGASATIVNSRGGIICARTGLVNVDHKTGTSTVDSAYTASDLGFDEDIWKWMCIPGTHNPGENAPRAGSAARASRRRRREDDDSDEEPTRRQRPRLDPAQQGTTVVRTNNTVAQQNTAVTQQNTAGTQQRAAIPQHTATVAHPATYPSHPVASYPNQAAIAPSGSPWIFQPRPSTLSTGAMHGNMYPGSGSYGSPYCQLTVSPSGLTYPQPADASFNDTMNGMYNAAGFSYGPVDNSYGMMPGQMQPALVGYDGYGYQTQPVWPAPYAWTTSMAFANPHHMPQMVNNTTLQYRNENLFSPSPATYGNGMDADGDDLALNNGLGDAAFTIPPGQAGEYQQENLDDEPDGLPRVIDDALTPEERQSYQNHVFVSDDGVLAPPTPGNAVNGEMATTSGLSACGNVSAPAQDATDDSQSFNPDDVDWSNVVNDDTIDFSHLFAELEA